MGMRGEGNTWLSCTVLLRMLNVTPLERQTRGRKDREGIPEANDAYVAGLNVIENQQDREDRGMESSRRKRTACT